MSKRSRIITLSVLSILIVICIVLGITYSFMQANIDSDSVTEVSLSSCAKITLEDGGDSINIENSYPVSRNKGMQSDPYTFTVTSSCESYVGFNLYLATLNTNTLSDTSIHYVITKHDSKEAIVEGILSEATNALSEFNSDEIDQLNIGIGGTYSTIYRLYNDSLPLQGSITYDLYLFIDELVTNDTMNQEFRAGVAIKSYDREADLTSLALDISLGNIMINEGSSVDTLYVSGGGLEEQVEIDNTLPIIITGSTEEYGISIGSGIAHITLNNLDCSGQAILSGVTPFYISGTVFLTVTGTNNLNGDIAIYLFPRSRLIIDGDGVLNSTGEKAGIGSSTSSWNELGTIIINSGTINATGKDVGIGGVDFELIEINGGNVTAISTGSGAGIGGINTNYVSTSLTGLITINGGTVYAQGGTLGAGIGGGGTGITACTNNSIPSSNIFISSNANVTAIAGGVYTESDIPPQNIGNGGYSC